MAVVQHATEMRSRPGGHVFAKLPVHTEFGSPRGDVGGPPLGSVARRHQPGRRQRPRRLDPGLRRVVGRVNWKLQVSLAARRLTVLHAGRAVAHFTIAVGAPGSPTPTGRFAVTDRLNTGDPAGPYGCCILALSA